MSLKKILVDRDVLVRDEPLPRFMLVDGVDQHGRMAITEAIEEYGDVHGHGGTKNIRKSEEPGAKSRNSALALSSCSLPSALTVRTLSYGFAGAGAAGFCVAGGVALRAARPAA